MLGWRDALLNGVAWQREVGERVSGCVPVRPVRPAGVPLLARHAVLRGKGLAMLRCNRH